MEGVLRGCGGDVEEVWRGCGGGVEGVDSARGLDSAQGGGIARHKKGLVDD